LRADLTTQLHCSNTRLSFGNSTEYLLANRKPLMHLLPFWHNSPVFNLVPKVRNGANYPTWNLHHQSGYHTHHNLRTHLIHGGIRFAPLAKY
jgi:hypothetical protein